MISDLTVWNLSETEQEEKQRNRVYAQWNGWETLCYRFLLAFLDLTAHNVQ